LPWAAA